MVLDYQAQEYPVCRPPLSTPSRHVFHFYVADSFIRLATVNFFVGCVGLTQLSRIGFYRWNLQKDTEQSQAQQPESGPEPEKNAAT